jgi:hypothetical protein
VCGDGGAGEMGPPPPPVKEELRKALAREGRRGGGWRNGGWGLGGGP